MGEGRRACHGDMEVWGKPGRFKGFGNLEGQRNAGILNPESRRAKKRPGTKYGN